MKKITLLLITFLCSNVLLFAQVVVKGKVTNAKDGQPLLGITVKEKGGDKAVATNEDGTYSITTDNANAVLEFSGVGFGSKSVKVSGNLVNVALEQQVKNMGEVVVTALGISRSKNTLPFSVQKVSGSDVNQSRNSNFVDNLSGKVAGLDIKQNNTMGGSTNVVLRGNKSLTGNNQALFVVDGQPFDNSTKNSAYQARGGGGYDFGSGAADINPDDIESVTVLKGAAASALYGSRGSNGAILITTKKGKKGLGITINSGVTVSSIDKTTFPTYQKEYGAGYGPVSGGADAYFDLYDIDGDGIDDSVVHTYDDASWGPAFNPNQYVYQWDAFDVNSPNYGKKTPWVAGKNDPSSFFETPVSYNTSIFLETGNDKGTLSLGYTRNNENGVLPNSNITKDLLNFSTTYKLNDQLTAGASANYSSINGLGRYGTGYDGDNGLNLMTTFRQWWQMNVDVKDLKNAYFAHNQNVTWNMSSPTDGALQPEFWDNPYFVRYQNFETDSRDRYFGNIYLNYKPYSWLNLLGRVSMDNYTDLLEERRNVGSVGVPYYRRYGSQFQETNYDFLANAEWDLNNDLNVKALLGSNTRIQSSSSIDAITNGGLGLEGLYTLANSINTPEPATQFQGTKRVEGFFGGATLTYKNTYILDATLRRDRSSTLPADHNFYYYPSLSAGFVFSQLMSDFTELSYGKLRLNYAEVGGDAPLYSVKDNYVTDNSTSFNGTALFSVSGTKNNPNLKSETTKSIEGGLEMSFFNSRVGFDLTLYSAKTVDQILPVTVSTATGYSRKYVNSGTVSNTGIELALYATPIKSDNFKWDINLNYTQNKSLVEELYNGVDNIVLGSFQGGVTLNASVNEPYGTIHGTDFIYTNGQRTIDENGEYLQTGTNNNTLGDINPDWMAGITNKFTYKNLSLSFLIDIKHGGSVFSTDMYYGLAEGLYAETAGLNDLGNPIRNSIDDGGGIIRPGVYADGTPNTTRVDVTDYGVFDSYVSAPDKRFVYDASYIKLRELSIGYTVPMKKFGDKFNKYIKGIELSLVGRNLAILQKNLPYADPEDSFGAGNLQGVQCGSYPTVRTIGFNVKIKI